MESGFCWIRSVEWKLYSSGALLRSELRGYLGPWANGCHCGAEGRSAPSVTGFFAATASRRG
jgi:hypothetical protein